MNMALVYILFLESQNHYYISHTTNTTEERLQKNLSHHSGFTSKAKDWKVVFTETYSTKEDAYLRGLVLFTAQAFLTSSPESL